MKQGCVFALLPFDLYIKDIIRIFSGPDLFPYLPGHTVLLYVADTVLLFLTHLRGSTIIVKKNY